ncbi:MAG: DUF2892 domain-containing protein [Saprospiraceae bacterium]|nr:DUF2892 domain-containing protein [Saprospiraceae bacterium]
MVKNMNSTDRIIRTLIAAAVVGLYFGNIISGTTAIVLGAVAGIFLLTSLVSFCPLYRLVGISTCSVKK